MNEEALKIRACEWCGNFHDPAYSDCATGEPIPQSAALPSVRWMDGGREQARNAFVKLHTQWLGANHRRDMNEGMDEMARALGLDPFTLKASNGGDHLPRAR